jgi:hypothetical protein
MKLSVTKWKQKEDATYSEDGLIRLNTNKPEYGSLMLSTTVVTINNNFLNKSRRVGFITGKVEDIEDIILTNNLTDGSDFSKEVSPHRIITLEKVESEMTEDHKGFSEEINPSTGEVLSKEGQVIFRRTMVVSEGSDLVDTLVSHDSVPIDDEARAEFQKEDNVVATL